MKTTKSLFGILTIIAALAVQVHAQTFLTNGLVAYYPFDGNANDASGNGRNGILNGSVLSSDRFGRAASACVFNALGQNVSVPNSLHPQGEVTLTYSCWVNDSQPTSAHSSVINVASFPPGGMFLPNTRSELGIVGDPSDSRIVYTGEYNDVGGFLSDQLRGGWHHIVLTKNSTNINVFVDGAFVAAAATQAGQSVTSTTLTIGNNGNPNHHSWEQFYGAIDDVRIYNRALSVSEIQQLYVIESGHRVDLIKAVKPSFSNLSLGTNYQLQVSGDLSTWTNTGSAFTATNTSMVYPQYWDVDDWDELFFRLQVAP